MSADLVLKSGYDENYNTCVTVGERNFTKAADLGAAFPNLIAEAKASPPLTRQLARALGHLRGNGTVALTAEQTRGEIEAWAEPPLYDIASWTPELCLAAPPLEAIEPPRWEGDALVFHTFNYNWSLQTKHVFVQKLTLDPQTWELGWENLEGERRALTRVTAAVEAAFGGLPAGFFSVTLPDYTKVLLGVGAGLSTRCVWLENKTADPVAFPDYAAFAAAREGALEPKAIAGVCSGLTSFFDQEEGFHGLQVIEDGQAYQDEYREKNWSTFKLRYWVDQIRTTSCHCPELDTVASPALEGNRLVAYYKGEKYQPFRIEVDLSTLAEAPEIHAMSTETLVSDTRGGPGGVLDVPLRVEPAISGPAPISGPEASVFEDLPPSLEGPDFPTGPLDSPPSLEGPDFPTGPLDSPKG